MTLNPLLRIASMGWAAWLATLVALACLCAVVTFWFLQLAAPKVSIAPALTGAVARDRPDLSAAGSLFGLPQQAQALAAAPTLGNVQVLGVIAAGRLGSAILIVDGKPARSFAVGDPIGPGQRVRSVSDRLVVIDDNGRRAEVAGPPPTSTAVLTSGIGKSRGPTDPAMAAPMGAASPMPGGQMPAGAMPGGQMPAPGQAGAAGSGPAQYVPSPGPMPTQNPSPPGVGKPGPPS